MSNFEPEVWAALVSLIQSTWPESALQIYRLSQIGDEALIRRLTTNEIIPPFVLIDWGASTPSDWGLDNEVYMLEMDIAYVVKNDDSRANQPDGSIDIGLFIASQLVSLREALVAYSGAFQLAGNWPQISLMVNQFTLHSFMAQELNLSGGILKCEILFGQSNN